MRWSIIQSDKGTNRAVTRRTRSGLYSSYCQSQWSWCLHLVKSGTSRTLQISGFKPSLACTFVPGSFCCHDTVETLWYPDSPSEDPYSLLEWSLGYLREDQRCNLALAPRILLSYFQYQFHSIKCASVIVLVLCGKVKGKVVPVP